MESRERDVVEHARAINNFMCKLVRSVANRRRLRPGLFIYLIRLAYANLARIPTDTVATIEPNSFWQLL